MIIKKKDKRMYWLIMNDKTLKVEVPENFYKDFLNAQLSVLPKSYPGENHHQFKAEEKEPILHYLDKKKPPAPYPFLSRLSPASIKVDSRAP